MEELCKRNWAIQQQQKILKHVHPMLSVDSGADAGGFWDQPGDGHDDDGREPE